LKSDGVGDEPQEGSGKPETQSTKDVGGESPTGLATSATAWSTLIHDALLSSPKAENGVPDQAQGSYSESEVMDALNAAVRDQRVRYYDTIQNKLVFKAIDELDDDSASQRLGAVLEAIEAARGGGAVGQALNATDGVALL
jgi:hypothetical protein